MTRDTYAEHRLDPKNPRNQFQGEPIISDQISREGLGVVWCNLEKTLKAGVHGDIVEFGCYAGTTSLFIRRLLDTYHSLPVAKAPPFYQPQSGQEAAEASAQPTPASDTKPVFHAYDSFEGLPAKDRQDANAAGVAFEAGKLYVSKKEFLQVFRSASLTPPIIHKGWFDELGARDVPEQIAFAFLDGDFYGSILSSLRLVYPRMATDGMILIDDYQRETLPGVERAISDYFQDKPRVLQNLRAEANIAIIQL